MIIIVSSLVFCLVTIKFQNGLNIKTVSSLISVLMVCIFSCVIIYIFSIKGHIGGFNEIEMQEEEVFFLGSAVEFKMVNHRPTAYPENQSLNRSDKTQVPAEQVPDDKPGFRRKTEHRMTDCRHRTDCSRLHYCHGVRL